MQSGSLGYQSCPVGPYQYVFSSRPRQLHGISSYCKWRMSLPSALSLRCTRFSFMFIASSEGLHGRPNFLPFGLRGHLHGRKRPLQKRFKMYAELDVASAIDVINDLGLDTLTFLVVTVMVVPVFKFLRASPVSIFFKLV